MKTAVEQFIEQLEIPKYQDIFGIDFILTIEKETKEKFIALEKEQIKNAFCAGWDKSKTALMPNKKNYYSQEYLNKIQDESN
jgi:hypothetical protein